jgi:uncharacterized membrane protein (DUF4010 family)
MFDEIPPQLIGVATALGLGLLIGVERERRRMEDKLPAAAGVRTFTLVALAGALAQMLGGVGIAVAGGFVALAALASYRASVKRDPGLTTEVALLVAFLLGVLAMEHAMLASGLGVVVALVLASKSRVHRFAREVLTETELHDGLLLAASALVVLPLLPDRAIDPWNALNLRKLWRLVVLIMTINAAGYIALRTLGPRHGLALAGFTGGFASSTATIAGMGSRTRTHPKLLGACVTGALLSNVATVIQLAIVLAAIAPTLLVEIAPGLAAAGIVAALYAVAIGWRELRTPAPKTDAVKGRPFHPGHALAFAALVAVILLIGGFVHAKLGDAGLVPTGAITGLADVHAAAGSIGQLVSGDAAALRLGALAVLAAFATNSASKAIGAFAAGGAAFGLRVLPGLVAIAGAFAAVVWLTGSDR